VVYLAGKLIYSEVPRGSASGESNQSQENNGAILKALKSLPPKLRDTYMATLEWRMLPLINRKDTDGWASLFGAVRNDYENTIALLFRRGSGRSSSP
jgi:ankyrin repeat protein